MSLKIYRAKRHFEGTPEPRGKRQSRRAPKLRFVVQKHAASRLHYDFRLEMGGVLKSWAVPKGPSLDPNDKRLAVHVEDHPLEYRTFEGTIPEGNYGAGTVMVWDEGTYEPMPSAGRDVGEKTLLEDLDAGNLKIILHGRKLRGEFALVRMKGEKGKNWLLIKHRDASADSADILTDDRSVRSRRNLSQIAEAAADGRRPRKIPMPPKLERSLLGHPIKPMLASPVSEPFDRKNWLFEVKWDGYRAIAEVADGEVKLYSRNLQSFEHRFAPVVQSLAGLRHEVVLDGEVVVVDDQGKSHFQLLQNYQKSRAAALIYYVFDLLYMDGKDLRSQPLRQRKQTLATLLKDRHNIRLSEHIEEHGIAFFEAASKQGLEGMVAKDAASSYQEGKRSRTWLKIKARQRQEAVIGGFTRPRGARQGLGALVLGVFEGDDLVYVGHSGSGFTERGLADMRARLDALIQPACPFKIKPKTNMPAQWVKPVLVCEVEFQDWTSDGSMRHPIFVGLREDKPARSVRRETPLPPPDDDRPSPSAKQRPAAALARRPASHASRSNDDLPAGNFTNQGKVFWPDEGYTKGDVLRYYHAVAPLILPYLRDRPMSLLRHPDGIHGKSFFQKDVAGQPPPAFVETAVIQSDSSHKSITYIVCQNEDTLLYIANLGCIELNPWNSRVETPDRPDYLILDLDPQDVPFAQVVEAAQEIHKQLDRAGVPCYCKTSGKRGLHIFVPLGARYTYDECRRAAETIARTVHKRLPETTSLVRQPALRRERVYIDCLKNARGQTLAAPYSLRPVEGARVSTPLEWREVNRRLDPTKFTIETTQRRLDRVGDLWKPVLGKGVDFANRTV